MTTDHWEDFHYSPEAFLGWALKSGWRPGAMPIGVIYTFQPGARQYLVDHPERFSPNRDLTVSNSSMFITADDNAPILIASLSPGAASLATQLEHLRFLGNETRFAAIVGTAGALAPGHHIGDTLVVNSAVRDDLISDRYLAPGRIVEGDRPFGDTLAANLGLDTQPVRTWTVAVPYRQTNAELDAAKHDRASTVEMEIATLFAVAQSLDYRSTAAVIISDVSNVDGWHSDWSETAGPTNTALDAVITSMRQLASV